MPQNVNLRDLLIVIVEEEDVLAVVDQFLHHHVLTLEVNELALGPRDRLQEVDVLDVALVSLDVVDEKLDGLVAEFPVHLRVFLEDGTHILRLVGASSA